MNMRKYLIITTACLVTSINAANKAPEINGQFFSDYIKNADTKKKDTAVEVDEIIKLVDATLHLRMQEIIKLAEESKVFQERANKILLEKKTEMAKIYQELLPLDTRLRNLYPDMVVWFDKLKQFIDENKIG